MLALGTASIAAASAILLGRSPTFLLLLMAYLFSYGAYMLNRGSEVTQDSISNPGRTNYLSGRSKYLSLISAVSFGIGYVIAFFTNLIFFFALIVPLALALVYSIGSKKLTGLIGAKRLKDKLLVKNLAISFGWSLIPVLVGLYYKSLPLLLLSFVPFIFFRLMSNTIFFDVRDVKADGAYGVRTIPVVYGKALSYNIMNLFDGLSVFVHFRSGGGWILSAVHIDHGFTSSIFYCLSHFFITPKCRHELPMRRCGGQRISSLGSGAIFWKNTLD